jgi:mannosyltransferase
MTTTAVRSRRSTYTLIAVGATVALAAMAAYRIGHKQMWVDEGVAVGLSHESLGRFLYVITHYEVNQSPFYVVFRVWNALGDDPAVMRALSAIFSVATIPLLYVLGRRLYDARVGAIASIVLAVNGLVLQWSQQVRAYTMAMFLVTLATYLFVRTVDEPSTTLGFLYGTVALAAIATHFFSVLVIAAHAVSLLILRPRPTRVFVWPAALIGALLVPIALFVATAEGDPLAWVDEPGGKVFGRALSRLAGGKFPLIVYAVLAGLGVVATVRAVRADPRSRASFRLLLPCLWAGLPIVVGILFSVVASPVFVAKFFIGLLPGAALVIAYGVVSLRARPVRIAALVVLVAFALASNARWYRADSREDWTAATDVVAEQAGPDDTVVVLPSIGGSVAEYYARHAHDFDLTVEVPDADEPPPSDVLWQMQGPVMSDWPRVRRYPEWRDRNYELVDVQSFKGITVSRYERRGG